MNIDYSTILKECFPTTLWKGSGATYDRIVWLGSPITQADLDLKHDEALRNVVLRDAQKRLLKQYENTFALGFTSSALGSPYWYEASLENQVKLSSAVTISLVDSAVVLPYPCADLSSTPPTPTVMSHNSAQISQVLLDGAARNIVLYNSFKQQVINLYSLTTAEIELANYIPPT